MSIEREYIVTLKSKNDLDNFYLDMETEGGSIHIPHRMVVLANRCAISRNTGYMLTDEESALVANDPRVQAVTLNIKDAGISIVPMAYLTTQTSNKWFKSSVMDETHLNWGILRCYEGQTRTNWGVGGTTSVSGTVELTNIGRNVDVVVMDGIFNPSHPEFALNFNGTGGTRAIRYNWYKHNPEVKGTAAGTYNYSSFITAANESNNNHGTHVAGTCTGNTLGWARAANIYNIYPYTGDPYLMAYVNEFHSQKPVGPAGMKNPTIVNMSFGFLTQTNVSTITGIKYRGVSRNAPSTAQLKLYGAYGYGTPFNNMFPLGVRYAPYEADIADGADAGIIWVAAAGNDNMFIDVPGGLDYDNTITVSGAEKFYHRGCTPSATPGVICVGAVGQLSEEKKADYSNTGPRIDIFAPGSSIMSSILADTTVAHDARAYSFLLGKLSGTSMATPQVTGLLANMLEIFPNLKQQDCLYYLQYYCSMDQLSDSAMNYDGFYNIKGAPNYYLKNRNERNKTGVIYPKTNYVRFKQDKQLFPTVKIRRKG